MKTIFVQVKCDLGKAYEVAGELVENVEAVSEVYSISGNYDLILKCYLDDESGYRPLRHRTHPAAARHQGHVYDDRL